MAGPAGQWASHQQGEVHVGKTTWDAGFQQRECCHFLPTWRPFQEFSKVKELQSFLGMVNFSRRFLPGVAHTLHPLTEKLHGSRKGSQQVVMHAAMDKAFAAAKQALLVA